MTSHPRSSLSVVLFLVMTACLACGGGKGGGEKAGGAEGAPKKVLHFYRGAAHKTLDPVKQLDQASAEIISNVYDTLVSYHYLKRPYELTPNLVTKMPELSADGLSYSFELRDDVRFIDDPCFPNGKGRQVTTDDVIYSFKRYADANLNVQSYMLLQGVIEGMDAFREQTSKLGKATDYAKLEISGLQKIDDRRFTIKLTRKNPLALLPLAVTPLSIVPREAVEHYKADFESHPVGTGPFKLKSLARRGTVVLERNPNYHGTYPSEGAPGDAEKGLLKAAGKRLPLLDQVELPLIEESQPAMLKFLSGGLDWVAMDRDNFSNMAFKDETGFHLKPEYAKKFDLYWEPALTTEFLVFNMNDPLIGKNKALRQAIAYALDAPAYVEQMRNGRGVAPTTLLPLPIAGSQRDVQTPWYTHDLAMAKKKLAEAGFPDGKGLPPIVVDYRASNTTVRQDYEFHRAQLAKAGIVITPNYQTFSAFVKKVDSGNFQVIEYAWGADYPDGENFYQLLYGPNKAPGPNGGSYSNPEYDKLYEQIKQLPNGPERFALFARMNEIIKEDVPLFFTWSWTVVGMRQKWVENFKRNMMVDAPFQYLDIDTARKAKGVK